METYLFIEIEKKGRDMPMILCLSIRKMQMKKNIRRDVVHKK